MASFSSPLSDPCVAQASPEPPKASGQKQDVHDDIQVFDIAQVPQHIDAVAEMCFKEWPEECKDVGINSVEEYAADIREEYMKEGSWPLVLVAIHGSSGKIVGTVALDPNDMDDRPQFKPWMASLLVTPDARGRGIGSKLITSVLSRAREYGLSKVYLWAKEDVCAIYERRGFTLLEHRPDYCGHAVNIMHCEL
jgi:N-acetylglutamate synthase-like GNAT family acetyltransferase